MRWNANARLLKRESRNFLGTKQTQTHIVMDNLGLKNRVSQPVHKTFQGEANSDKDEICEDAVKSRGLTPDRTVWLVFFSLLVDLLAFTVILPLFPSLLEFYANKKEVSPWGLFMF